MKTANEAMKEILDEKDLNINELNHLIYAAATVITEEINGTGEYTRSDSKVMRLIFFWLYWQYCSLPTQTAITLILPLSRLAVAWLCSDSL